MINVQTFTGADVAPHLDAVAELRIAVFRDWPYL
ncbi:MAG: GNAT family N-acetyltransferase, partial [Dokdonella sp.]